jgi:N-acylneuraminate cytidylyltransferase
MKLCNEIWALIPARSGSKNLKNKNIKLLKGKPLIDYSLMTAKKSPLISKVIFSSDSLKYISLAKKFNCNYYHLRSKKSSRDFATDLEVFKEVITFLKKKKIILPKFFVHLRPTTPIRKISTINSAIRFFKKNEKYFTSLKSVTFNSHNSLKDYIIKRKKLFSINEKKGFNIDKVNLPSQNLTKTYIGSNVVDIYKTRNILKGKLLGNRVYPFITHEPFCDIDTMHDFVLCQYLYKNYSL